jgi:hypothetical protein
LDATTPRGDSPRYHVHVAFRDTFDKCPRCGTALEDAHSARGCRTCGGAFVEEPVLAEMILQMLPPPPRVFGTLALSELARQGTPLPCATCAAPMRTVRIHDIDLDHCPKHGVWFDPNELRVLLYRSADPKNPPPFDEWSPIAPRLDAPRPKPPAPPPIDIGGPSVTFRVSLPDDTWQDVTIDKPVVKVGRLATCALRIQHDDTVSRLHAVIEIEPDGMTIIDLGSGTRRSRRASSPSATSSASGTRASTCSVDHREIDVRDRDARRMRRRAHRLLGVRRRRVHGEVALDRELVLADVRIAQRVFDLVPAGLQRTVEEHLAVPRELHALRSGGRHPDHDLLIVRQQVRHEHAHAALERPAKPAVAFARAGEPPDEELLV